MDWSEIIAELQEDLRDFVRQAVANVIRFSIYAGTTADGQGDSVAGRPTSDSPNGEPLNARRMQHYGFRSFPPAGMPSLTVHADGGIEAGVIVSEDDPAVGPALEHLYDVALYSKSGASIYIKDSDGSITVIDKGGAKVFLDGSGNVIVNDGANKVARVTDTVDRNSAMGVWMTAVETALNSGGHPTGSPWHGISPGSSTIATISSGADNFKG